MGQTWRVALLTLGFLACQNGTSRLIAQTSPLDFSCTNFPPNVTEDDLVARFGAEHVRTDTLRWSGEYQGEGTVIFSDRADARLEIIWSDLGPERVPYRVAVCGVNSRWQAPNGVSPGDDLLSLERGNRLPVRLAGFQTELAGAVLSWAGGDLEMPEHDGCRISIHLQPRWDGTEDFDLVRQVRSGREYSSGHPAMQQLNPRVVSLYILYF